MNPYRKKKKPQQVRKDCSSPFESKLIFSYSCERCFEDKKRQKRDH